MQANFAGTNRQYLVQPGLRLVHTQCPALMALPHHEHVSPFLSFLMHGVYREGVNGNWNTCEENSLTWHPANDAHAVEHGSTAVNSLQLEFLNEEFDGINIARVFPKHRISSTTEQVRVIISALQREMFYDDSFSSVAIQGFALQLLSTVGRLVWRERFQTNERIVTLVDTAICEASPAPPNFCEIVRKLGLSEAKIAYKFKEATGETIAARARRLRVERACSLLAERDMPLAQVAIESGFYDQAHFTRAFSNIMRCTPGRYKKRLQ